MLSIANFLYFIVAVRQSCIARGCIMPKSNGYGATYMRLAITATLGLLCSCVGTYLASQSMQWARRAICAYACGNGPAFGCAIAAAVLSALSVLAVGNVSRSAGRA